MLGFFWVHLFPFLDSGTHYFAYEMLPARIIGWLILAKIVFVRVLFVAF
jgi:hypothetical protein